MIYAMIKALKVNSDESLIVVSCLSKDITASRIDVFRANAIRVLATVIDANMLGQIDRCAVARARRSCAGSLAHARDARA
jgi:hypothetical protein